MIDKQVAGLVTVIMPCFNAWPYVRDAVGSVMSQSHENIQLLIVDDGSTDETPVFLMQAQAQYSDRLFLYKQCNKGPYPARNLGLEHVRGEYVAFLDADDYWDTGFVERMLKAVGDSGAQLAYCGWQNVGDGGPGDAPFIPPDYGQGDMTAMFLRDCPWPIHAALMRRELVDWVGGFSERYFSSLDYDFWLRILGVTHDIVRVPKVLAYYRWHGSGQISANRSRQVIDAWRVRRDFVRDHAGQVDHLSRSAVNELVNGPLRSAALDAFWRRDLATAQKLLRTAFLGRALNHGDLRYAIPAFLPPGLFDRLARLLERKSAG